MGKKFVVVYDGLFYTQYGWGPTFTPNRNQAALFTEKQAKEVVRDLKSFKGISYCAA